VYDRSVADILFENRGEKSRGNLGEKSRMAPGTDEHPGELRGIL
jgi:hypothetical protein